MFNFDDIANENNAKYNLEWQFIPDYTDRILIFEGSESEKTNVLLNLIKEEDCDLFIAIDKMYLYAKDLNEPKYQLLIKKNMNMLE